MKRIVFLFLSFGILVTACRVPSEPEGELEIINRLETIDTGGECLDLDVADSLMVVAANYNGFQIFNLFDSNGNLNPLKTFQGTDMAPNLGDDRIEKVFISKEKDFMVLFDKYDKIYLLKTQQLTFNQK